MIVIEARVLDTPHLQLPEEVPVVIADSKSTHEHPTFGMDEAAGARAAVGHLLDLGHTTVHHVAGPLGSNPAERRRAAWKPMLQRAGRPVPSPAVGDWSPESGYAGACQLLVDDAVTAIFTANDQMAAGVLRAADELRLRVPEDLSVVGYDDLDITPYFSPPLTTVRQDLAAVGRRCLDHLLAQIESGPERSAARSTSRLVHRELVIRDPTAPPRR